jgi:hypothetical protein
MAVAAALSLSAWCLDAVVTGCIAKATPDAVDKDYTCACGCKFTKITTDEQGQQGAPYGICRTCAASTGGCAPDTGTYPTIYECTYTGSCQDNACTAGPTRSGPSVHYNSTMYKYLPSGCGT